MNNLNNLDGFIIALPGRNWNTGFGLSKSRGIKSPGRALKPL